MRMTFNSGKQKIRKIVGTVIRGGLEFADTTLLIVYNNTLQNVYRGLMERLYNVKDGQGGFKPCPKPIPGIFKTLEPFKDAVTKCLPKYATPMTREEFCATYRGSKQKRYLSAAATLSRRPLRRSDSYVGAFIKGEFYNATNKFNPAPRLIQPRKPEYLLETGRYLKPIEKRIYKAIDKAFGHHAVLKCDNPIKRGATIAKYWAEFKDPCFKGMDASRFDQHVSSEALEWEHSVYKAPYGRDKYLNRLLWDQVKNVGYAQTPEGWLRYEVEGCRMSGDMNTALGNVLLMCGITKHFLDGLGVKYRFIDDGDDCGVIMEREHIHLLDTLPEHHLQYGFEMEMEEAVFRIEDIEFCQCKPIHLGNEKYVLVRNVHKAMSQDRLHIDKDWANLAELTHAIGICGLSLNHGLPVLDAFYRGMLNDEVRENKVRRLVDERHGDFFHCGGAQTLSEDLEVDLDAARVSFYYAFNILPDMQIDMESAFRAAALSTEQAYLNYNAKSTDRHGYHQTKQQKE